MLGEVEGPPTVGLVGGGAGVGSVSGSGVRSAGAVFSDFPPVEGRVGEAGCCVVSRFGVSSFLGVAGRSGCCVVFL